MNKRIVTFLLLGLLIIGLAEWDVRKKIFAPIRKLDNFWVDFCLGSAGSRVTVPSVTMVRITDDYEPVSIAGVEAQPQDKQAKSLSKLDYGTFLYAISKMNPKTVVFMPAPVFDEKAALNQASIFPLKDAALQVPRMVCGSVVSGEGEATKGTDYPAIQTKGDTSKIPEIKKTVIPVDPDFLANGEAFFLSHESFPSGTGFPTRDSEPRVQLVARQGDKVVPGFILAAVARQVGVKIEEISLDLDSRPTIKVGNFFTIPVAADGSMAIPSHAGLSHAMYRSSTGENGKEKRTYHFASLKVEDVALAAEKSASPSKLVPLAAQTILNEFQGKFESLASNLVLLGFDRNSERTIDNGNGASLSPMTATARAIATIQSGRYTSPWTQTFRAGAYGVIIVLGLVLLSLKRETLPLIFGAGVVAIIALVLIFRQTLYWTSPAYIAGLFLVMFFAGMMSRGARKQETQQEIQGTESETGTPGPT